MNVLYRYFIAIGIILTFTFIASQRAVAGNFITQTDSVKKIALPKVPVKLPKVKAPKAPKVKAPQLPAKKTDSIKIKPPGLLKKLSQDLIKALQFRKRAQAKEKIRVIKLVDSLVIQNPEMAKATDLNQLKQQLTDSAKMRYNELVIKLLALQKEVSVLADTSADSVKNQQTINTLVAKVVPMLKSVENDQTVNLSRQKRIQVIRGLFGQPATKKDTAKINDTLSLIYRLRLKHKKPVWGYVSYQNQDNGVNYNYEILSGALFYTYQLDPYSGYIKDLGNSHTSAVMKQVLPGKSAIHLSFFYDGINISSFLTNKYSQATFNASVLKQLQTNQVNWANIFFANIPVAQQQNFTTFIRNLYKFCKNNNPAFQLSITLPGLGNNTAYSLKDLDPYVSAFVLDFSKSYTGKAGPIAPLYGYRNNNIQSAIAKFANTGILPAKFMLCLPYQGIQYTFSKPGAAAASPVYIPYKTIRSKFNNAFYNLDSTVAFATQTSKTGAIDTVWFDDENTLAKKYDYIFLSGLGGVVVRNLEDGDGYGELWDALTDKFMDFDTVRIKTINNSLHPLKLTFWQNVQKYYYLFNKPCDTTFNAPMQKMLGISVKNNRPVFKKTVKEAMDALHIVNLVLAVILIVGIIVLIYYIRMEGEWWPWKKPLTGFLIVIVHLFILTGFMSLYLMDSIPWFGASNKDGCINMPFHDLMGIIIFGLVTGMLIMRFLIFPFIKKEDIP
ncbi:glycoside hydrolase family 18 protein [Mucilaginibacter sp. RS28]|uniref:Glycoside hydrolase family 18 protein n=1 Tax=Mucilaginibacter straminoryzae TaxID=2932774 RepID=A0A9X1X2G8_9SPHI|nr:glycoside hydrolase family 18 protein [Mucilaginibacter straminoryzae]MCJ8208318.1 glycoside hydrolase family 18 protein [Mucilaginibacter straminoryzae]